MEWDGVLGFFFARLLIGLAEYHQVFEITVQRYLLGELIAVTGYSYYLIFFIYHPLPIIYHFSPTTYLSAN